MSWDAVGIFVKVVLPDDRGDHLREQVIVVGPIPGDNFGLPSRDKRRDWACEVKDVVDDQRSTCRAVNMKVAGLARISYEDRVVVYVSIERTRSR